MIGKLPKSEASKQSDPDRLGLLLHPRHSSKLEPRNPIEHRRTPTKLPRPSYEDGSQQARRPFGPQSLATLPTRLRLATTLRMRALQVEFPNCCVCVNFHRQGGIDRVEWDLHQLREVNLVPGGGPVTKPCGWPSGVASTNFLHQLRLLLLI
jgi:hypothetical protein